MPSSPWLKEAPVDDFDALVLMPAGPDGIRDRKEVTLKITVHPGNRATLHLHDLKSFEPFDIEIHPEMSVFRYRDPVST